MQPASPGSPPRPARTVLTVAIAAVAALAIAAAAAPTVAAGAQEPSGSARPNVVVIMTDDQRVDDLAVMPNVRALLADRGTTFANSFSSYPLCCPSRATLLTGQYSHNHGVEFNQPPTGGYQALDGGTTLPVALQEAGYHTTHIGKYLNGYGTDDPTEVPPGWTDWRGSVDPSTYLYQDYTLNENGTLHTYTDYQTDHYAALATDLIRDRAEGEQPFFLNLAVLAPHAQVGPGTPQQGGITQPVPAARHEGTLEGEPLPMPPSFNEQNVSDKPDNVAERPLLTEEQIGGIEANNQARRESLLAVDEAVAAVVATLEETGELDDTVIVFTSDNGFFLGEHRVPSGKFLVYEESVRVPLIVRGPGFAEGAVQDTLVANVDTAPTIFDVTGATPLVPPDGRSLVPLLTDPAATWTRDLLLQTGENNRGGPVYQAIRTPHYLYAEYDTGERELYDLDRDPYQRRSVHDEPEAERLRDRLAERLDDLRTCSGSSCW